MRLIKFRGKRIDNGEWVEGSLLQDDYETCMIVEFVDHHEQWHEVDRGTVGEYTGLKDKDGREIYEGDILRITMNIHQCKPIIRNVKVWFDNSSFVCDWGNSGPDRLDSFSYIVDFEVIGNIHESSIEELKKQQ